MRDLHRNRNAMVFAEWFGVPLNAGLILAALFDADTVPMTAGVLANRLSLSPDATGAALDALRSGMDPGELVTDGQRYALTEDGCADCRAALDDDASRRAAA